MFPRIFGNMNDNCIPGGTFEENGSGKMNGITVKAIKSLKDLGVNHIWLTGIIEMATKSSFPNVPGDNPNVVKGEAGSPYAIKDYYDVAPSLAEDVDKRIEEFESLVERIHSCGLKVIIDFVPNHTARQYHSDVKGKEGLDFGTHDDINKFFAEKNNYYYIPKQQFVPNFPLDAEGEQPYVEFPAKATGNDCFTAFCSENDWYETVKLNYGLDPVDNSHHFEPIPDTWLKMRDILRYWVSKGVDGFRCDMVFMVPKEFWNWVIPEVKKDNPELIFIGEIYDTNLYRPFLEYCHFDYLYDKVNLYDTLVGIERHDVSAAQLTYCWQTVNGIGDKMLNFLENHDEVRFGSDEYSGDPHRVIPSLVVSTYINKGPFMIYYGQELGERGMENEGFAGYNNRSTIFDYWSYDKLRRWYDGGNCSVGKLSKSEKHLRNTYKRILKLANKEEAFRKGEFFDLMYVNLQNPQFNPHRQFTFLRYTENQVILVVANFGNESAQIKLNVPELAFNMAKIKEGRREMKELLGDTSKEIGIYKETGVELFVEGHNAVLIEVQKNK